MDTKKIILAIIFSLALPVISAAYVYADEKITLSTYYPAPYGEYRTLAVGDAYAAPAASGNTDLVVEGNVGIGTTNPGEGWMGCRLGIHGSTANTPAVIDISGQGDDYNYTGIELWDNARIYDSSSNYYWGLYHRKGTGGAHDFLIAQYIPDGTGAGTYIEPIRIKSDTGYVGIGTTAPSNTIQVKDLINFNNTVYLTSIGYLAGDKNVTTAAPSGGPYNGYKNVFVGYQAGFNNTNGQDNTFIGSQAGINNTTGCFNAFVGEQAGFQNTTGNANTFIGYEAAHANTTGTGNTAIGFDSFQANTTGNWNTAVGYLALYDNTTGEKNTVIGTYAGQNNTTGFENTFVGYQAAQSNTTGVYNVAIGTDSLGKNTTSGYNTVVGMGAFREHITGEKNTAIGYQAGFFNATGLRNVFLGYRAGLNETGSDKLYIANSETNPPLIYGNFATAMVGINKTTPGTALDVNGTINSSAGNCAGSDIRWKEDISTLKDPLGKILQTRGVEFKWKKEKFPENNFPEGKQIGIIAQELEKQFPELVITDAQGYKSIAYDRLTAVLIEAIKELDAKNKKLEQRITDLEKRE